MIANYHTHTARCHHADGTPREYAQAAVQNGLQILGFSDHVPYPFSNGYHSGFRMEVSETEEYVSELAALREEYSGTLQLYIGYEAEYYPKEFERMLENVCKHGCDYLILGQHCLNNEYDGIPSGGQLDSLALKTYADQCIAGMQTGAFSCLAHPDLPNHRGTQSEYCEQMARICTAAKAEGIPLELNAYGLWDGRAYPNRLFWQLVRETGNDVVVGCDAHWASFTGNPEAVAAATRFLADFGIRPLEQMELKNPLQALERRCKP